MKRHAPLFAALLAFAIAACAPTAGELIADGQTALRSGHSAEALGKFDEALKLLRPEDAFWVDAMLGRIEALIDGQAAKAVRELLALARERPAQFGEKQIVYFNALLVDAHKYKEAIDLVSVSLQLAGGESPGLLEQAESIKRNAAMVPGAKSNLLGSPCRFDY